jgi:hypothetical protein
MRNVVNKSVFMRLPLPELSSISLNDKDCAIHTNVGSVDIPIEQKRIGCPVD